MFCGPNSIATSYSFVASRMWLGCQQQHRSEEHTSELQSQSNLVCRLLLEKKKNRTATREKPVSTHAVLLGADFDLIMQSEYRNWMRQFAITGTASANPRGRKTCNESQSTA